MIHIVQQKPFSFSKLAGSEDETSTNATFEFFVTKFIKPVDSGLFLHSTVKFCMFCMNATGIRVEAMRYGIHIFRAKVPGK